MARARTKNKDNARRSKKRTSLLTQERVTYVDYKDVNLLRRFQSDRAKIRARRVTGNSAQQQSEVAAAIKNAREMALLPYSSRVTQQRGGRGRDDRRGGGRDRDGRDDRDDRDESTDEVTDETTETTDEFEGTAESEDTTDASGDTDVSSDTDEGSEEDEL